jgi:hypothetical protein
MDFLRQVGQFLFPPSLLSWQTLILVVIALGFFAFWVFNFSLAEILILFKASQILGEVRRVLTPATWDSWQALVWISVFSWAVSFLATGPNVQGIIASIAWIFLIAGLHWAMHDKEVEKRLTFGPRKLFIGHWITGGLISVFLFGGLFDRDPSYVFVYWFPLSALVAIAPKFIKRGPAVNRPAPGARQDIVILVLINLLVSCWFQLYFTTQGWVQRYPNLFPSTIDSRPSQSLSEAVRSTGVAFLDQAEAGLRTNLAGLPWPQVERWLLNLNSNLQAISDASKLKLGTGSEPWRLEGRLTPGQEYQVQLWGVWRDPKTQTDREYLLKTCAVDRKPISSATPTTLVAAVRCGTTETPKVPIAPAPSPARGVR